MFRENLEIMKSRSQAKLIEERKRAEDLEEQAQIIIGELRAEIVTWKGQFLAWLANQAIADIPKVLAKAEGMVNPLETPVEIYQFFEFCRKMYEEMKKLSSAP
ncbi:hypothetical protein CR513_32396, partial [Mucuna pruriens]